MCMSRIFFSSLVGLQTFLLHSYFWFSCGDLILIDTCSDMLGSVLGLFPYCIMFEKVNLYLSSLVSNSSEEI